MPLFGQLSFLQPKEESVYQIIISVNALIRATLFSTDCFVTITDNLSGGVNALIRATLFSTKRQIFTMINEGGCVNALIRATLFSTGDIGIASVEEIQVSMPLFGQLSFLHVFVQMFGSLLVIVSMPLFGRLPFLRSYLTLNNKILAMCQCPYSGDSLFYGTLCKRPILEVLRDDFCRCSYHQK